MALPGRAVGQESLVVYDSDARTLFAESAVVAMFSAAPSE